MALFKDPNEQEQEQGTAQLGSQAVGTVSGGSAGNPAAGGSTPQAAGSGSFVNLSRYMNANQGNEAVGNSVNDIDKIGQDAQDGFKGANDSFNSLAVNGPSDLDATNKSFLSTAGTAADNYNKADKNNDVTTGKAYGGLNGIGGNTDAGLAQARGAIDNIAYKGPTSGDIGKSYASLNTAKGTLDNASKTFEASPDGVAMRRQSLVDTNTQRASGNYGAGAGNLDSLLTEKQGQPTFDHRRDALSQMASTYNPNAAAARSSTLSTQAKAAQDQADTYKSQYGGQFSNIKNTWDAAKGREAALQAARDGTPTPGTSTGDLAGTSFAGNWQANVKPATPAPAPTPVYSAPQPPMEKRERTQ